MAARVYENGQWVDAANISGHTSSTEPHSEYVYATRDSEMTGPLTLTGPDFILSNGTNKSIRFFNPGIPNNAAGIAPGKNVWLYSDSAGDFYLLMDKTGNNSWAGPHPMRIAAGGNGEIQMGQPPRLGGAGQYLGYSMHTSTALNHSTNNQVWTNIYEYTIPANTLTEQSRLLLLFSGDFLNSSGASVTSNLRVGYNEIYLTRGSVSHASSTIRRAIEFSVEIIHPTATTWKRYAEASVQSGTTPASNGQFGASDDQIGQDSGTVDMSTPTYINIQALNGALGTNVSHRNLFSHLVLFK